MTTANQAEPIRLVIWDLDDTYWNGTLSEGGIRYRRDCHDTVVELAKRGIVSSICSKNHESDVREILEREGIWDKFVFPSINWEPKGPRLANLVEAVQLRPASILLIDDNPMNRAEAQHFAPGIQVADETIIPELLDSPLCRGKDDSELTRLAQYRLLERRHADEKAAGADTTDFLRASNIRISIEHDLGPHYDRAIELINRTNQLNFSKTRLSEGIQEARAELREILSNYRTQAGIVRVRDNYGDYGYCGLYIVRSGGAGQRLLQFCFSCRILNMGVETWLYRHLGRPALKVAGEVLADVKRDTRPIDWITVELPEVQQTAEHARMPLDYVYARGGCDLHAVSHYFNMAAGEVHREFNAVRGGANLRLDHSMFARFALRGVSEDTRKACAMLGYKDEDFATVIPALPVAAMGVWILSFWADADFALYRHRKSGESVPLSLPGMQTNMRNMMNVDIEDAGDPDVRTILRSVREEFDYVGMISEADFKENLALLLSSAPESVRVFILLANERNEERRARAGSNKRLVNKWTKEVAGGRSNVELLDVTSFVLNAPERITHNHFDRMVYYRIFQHVMNRLGAAGEPTRAVAA